MKLEYAPEAIHDIQETKRYIATVLKNRTAAIRITKMIFSSCAQLKERPQLGMSVEVKTGIPSDLRYLICESWLAFYRIRDDRIQIVRVLDGRSDYVRILFSKQ